MNVNIQVLVSVCERLGVPYQILHPDGNLVSVSTPSCDRIFANWGTPLNDQTIARLCADKDYAYQALSPLMPMPKTRAFLDPNVSEKYQHYVKWPTHTAIVEQIEQDFSYPLIIKQNRGSLGRNVYQTHTAVEVLDALQQIFDPASPQYDYAALAQQYINITAEYRAVFLQGKLMFAYLKDTSQAQANENLSPFRWQGTTARLENDAQTLAHIEKLVSAGLQKYKITYTGVDIAMDPQGQAWVLELNGSPGYGHLIDAGGQPAVEHLYEQILGLLRQS